MFNTHELAWAAGFFDGEGCTTFPLKSKDGRCYPVLIVGQKDLRPLFRFQKALGNIGTIYKPMRNGISQWRCANFEAVQHVICCLWKFLSEPKREQAIRVLQAYAKQRGSRLAYQRKAPGWKLVAQPLG